MLSFVGLVHDEQVLTAAAVWYMAVCSSEILEWINICIIIIYSGH